MENIAAVEVQEPGEYLAGYIRKDGLVRDVDPFLRSFIHILEKDLDLPVVIEHVVTSDDVKVIHIHESFDLSAHLDANGVLIDTGDHLEGVKFTGGPLLDLAHGTSKAATDAIEARELGRSERKRIGGIH